MTSSPATVTALPASRPVLSDLVRSRVSGRSREVRVAIDAGLVLAGTALVAVCSQLTIPLPFTPVPLSLSTFAVLLSGLALGPARGLASMALYLVAGVAGVPWFAGHSAGWHFASFGYVIGYAAAALAVGSLARSGADRRFLGTVLTAVVGSLAIYACGVPWLMAMAHVSLGRAVVLGVVPFLVGDAIKSVLAASTFPTVWRVLDRH